MELEERIKRVLSYEKTKNKWRKQHASVEFREASQLNNDLYGKPLNKSAKCECVEDLFMLLRNMNQKKINQKKTNMNRKFEIKAGKVIQSFNQPDQYTNDNITDEKALELLKSSPGLIKFFSKFPHDWREQAQNFSHKKPADKPVEKPETIEEKITSSRKETLLSQTDKELKATCTAFNLPEREWKKLKREDMVDYILKKIPA